MFGSVSIWSVKHKDEHENFDLMTDLIENVSKSIDRLTPSCKAVYVPCNRADALRNYSSIFNLIRKNSK